jgi:hypothetical protein
VIDAIPLSCACDTIPGMQTAKSYRRHVANGRIALDEPIVLPEGAAVNVRLLKQGAAPAS